MQFYFSAAAKEMWDFVLFQHEFTRLECTIRFVVGLVITACNSTSTLTYYHHKLRSCILEIATTNVKNGRQVNALSKRGQLIFLHLPRPWMWTFDVIRPPIHCIKFTVRAFKVTQYGARACTQGQPKRDIRKSKTEIRPIYLREGFLLSFWSSYSCKQVTVIPHPGEVLRV